jgi:hypothetical protein
MNCYTSPTGRIWGSLLSAWDSHQPSWQYDADNLTDGKKFVTWDGAMVVVGNHTMEILVGSSIRFKRMPIESSDGEESANYSAQTRPTTSCRFWIWYR